MIGSPKTAEIIRTVSVEFTLKLQYWSFSRVLLL